jgi:hypothetical protein
MPCYILIADATQMLQHESDRDRELLPDLVMEAEASPEVIARLVASGRGALPRAPCPCAGGRDTGRTARPVAGGLDAFVAALSRLIGLAHIWFLGETSLITVVARRGTQPTSG